MTDARGPEGEREREEEREAEGQGKSVVQQQPKRTRATNCRLRGLFLVSRRGPLAASHTSFFHLQFDEKQKVISFFHIDSSRPQQDREPLDP